MNRDRIRGTWVALILLAAPLAAQAPVDSTRPVTKVRQAPGTRYAAGGLHRFLLGREYRELWTTAVEVSVLDLTNLKPQGRTGGQETKTLKLGTPDGHQFFFRSIDKDPSLTLPPELRGTVASRVVQDQTSSANPLAPLVVARLMDAVGILHNNPALVVLPDDPALGEFRHDFAGVMGFIEERIGGSGPAAHWHGAAEVIDSDTLFARVERSPEDQVDPRALLRARLFDVFIGDWDRHRDQWRWARMDDSLPRRWRPVPLDRDQAFVKYDGLLLGIARQTVPQLVNFGPHYAYMEGQTWNGRELDRRFLVGLERPAWDSVSRAVQAALSDSVIDEAVRLLPPEHFALIGVTLEGWLKHRRDVLPEAAERFYRMLAGQVDVHGTDLADRAALQRAPDGSVTLSLATGADTEAYFHRRFLPGETGEVRLFLGAGDDSAVVRGEGSGITLRILGDSGQDRLADSARSGDDRFYDADAGPGSTTGRASHVDRRSWEPPIAKDPHTLPPRDWGHRWQPSTWATFGPDIGLFLGGGRTLTTYGFRKFPFASRHRFRAGFATGPATYRVDYRGEFHRENSGVTAELNARASGIDVIRFHGFGNETTAPGSNEFYRVTQHQVGIAPSLRIPLTERLTLAVGPSLKYVSTDDRPGRFLATINPYGKGKFGELGAEARLLLDTRNRSTAATHGLLLDLGGSVHPAWWDVRETFGEAHGEAAVYLSPPAPLDPTLALRIGGKKLWGAYPFFDAAFIGGPETVRLGRENRYAGDASAYGTAELRVALTRAMIVVPADLGVFGLADAGRVFLAGESSSKWHTAFGGGVWASFLNRANTISVALAASDERTRVYVQAGFGF
jgi:hypothetical protein